MWQRLLPSGPQRTFLVLTFVVMIGIIVLSDTLTTALLLISLMTNFLIISAQMTMINERHDDHRDEVEDAVMPAMFPAMSAFTGSKEGFAERPVQGFGGAYPGGLDDVMGLGYDIGTPGLPPGTGAPVYTPVSASGADGPIPAVDAPFYHNRLSTRAEPPFGSDPEGLPAEAVGNFDADRLMVEHSRWRSDIPHRQTAGIHRRKDLMDKYVREELDEEEATPWWGRGEY
jgi:hypothetical protein